MDGWMNDVVQCTERTSISSYRTASAIYLPETGQDTNNYSTD